MAQATRTWSPPGGGFLHFPPHPIFALVALIVMASGGIWAFAYGPLHQGQNTPTYQTGTVAQGNLAVTVSATGPISSENTLPLTFKNAGRLAEVYVDVSDHVTAGQTLAKLDTSDLDAQLAQAQASLDQASANATKIAAGPTREVVAASRAQVAAAQTSLETARRNLAAAQASADQDIQASQASIDTATVNLANAQRALDSAQSQADAALASDRVALANAQKGVESARSQYDAGIAADN